MKDGGEIEREGVRVHKGVARLDGGDDERTIITSENSSGENGSTTGRSLWDGLDSNRECAEQRSSGGGSIATPDKRE